MVFHTKCFILHIYYIPNKFPRVLEPVQVTESIHLAFGDIFLLLNEQTQKHRILPFFF